MRPPGYNAEEGSLPDRLYGAGRSSVIFRHLIEVDLVGSRCQYHLKSITDHVLDRPLFLMCTSLHILIGTVLKPERRKLRKVHFVGATDLECITPDCLSVPSEWLVSCIGTSHGIKNIWKSLCRIILTVEISHPDIEIAEHRHYLRQTSEPGMARFPSFSGNP